MDLSALNEKAIEDAADSYVEGFGIDFDGTLEESGMARVGFIAGWKACCRVSSEFMAELAGFSTDDEMKK